MYYVEVSFLVSRPSRFTPEGIFHSTAWVEGLVGSRVRRDAVMREICPFGDRSPVLLHPHSLAAVVILLFRCENTENHVRMRGLEKLPTF